MNNAIPSWKNLLRRGAKLKCPRCGEGPLFSRWIRLRDHCPDCGLKYLENQGDLWALLLFADRVLFMVPLVVVFLIPQDSRVVWPYFFGGTLAIALVATFPYRMGISVALEYRIRLNSGDLSQPGGRN
ncbi:MAG TPA: DUF983 domain-containing protein [Candidatus Paceibacterota bacterium]|nr:DUF983 domain-containing protein [Candidatus Paceibacterota bacterium]